MSDWTPESSYPFSGAAIAPYEDSFSHALETARLFIWARESLRSFPEHIEDIGAYIINGLDFLDEKEKLTPLQTVLGITEAESRLNLTGFEFICLCLAAAYEINSLFGQAAQNEPPTFSLAAALYAASIGEGALPYAPGPYPLGYLLDIEDNENGHKCFYLKKYVFQYITGNTGEDEPHIRFIQGDCKFSLYPELLEELRRCLGMERPGNDRLCIVLSGKLGSGRRTLAAEVCQSVEKGAISVTPPIRPDEQAFDDILKKAAGLSMLTDSYIIADANNPDTYPYWNALSRHVNTLFLCAAPDERPVIDGFTMLRLDMPEPEVSDRAEIWRLLGHDLSFDPVETSERYRLPVGQIAAVTTAARLLKTPDSEDHTELLRREISRQNTGSSLTRLIHPAFTMDDLVVNERIKTVLRRIRDTFRLSPRLYTRGYGRLFPYGRGLGVLFHGASGLGKTMAAQVLAKELGLDVMAADLSRMADKYIGETEKHITEVFNTARENNCVLFFDEADAMFAKRAKVSDAQDRHANSHTAHLLQKMEDYSGLVILSTNLMGNVDDAFKRRLPFIVEFTRPDEKLRERLWRNFLPGADAGIDIQFLSRTFDITPAVIKWSAFSAAISAESEGISLTMEHILDALRYEYEKTGAVFPERDIDIVL